MSKNFCVRQIDAVATGKQLQQLRKENGLTITQLLNLFGFYSPSRIMRWEKGIALPPVRCLSVLASLYGVKIDDIIVYI